MAQAPYLNIITIDMINQIPTATDHLASVSAGKVLMIIIFILFSFTSCALVYFYIKDYLNNDVRLVPNEFNKFQKFIVIGYFSLIFIFLRLRGSNF